MGQRAVFIQTGSTASAAHRGGSTGQGRREGGSTAPQRHPSWASPEPLNSRSLSGCDLECQCRRAPSSPSDTSLPCWDPAPSLPPPAPEPRAPPVGRGPLFSMARISRRASWAQRGLPTAHGDVALAPALGQAYRGSTARGFTPTATATTTGLRISLHFCTILSERCPRPLPCPSCRVSADGPAVRTAFLDLLSGSQRGSPPWRDKIERVGEEVWTGPRRHAVSDKRGFGKVLTWPPRLMRSSPKLLPDNLEVRLPRWRQREGAICSCLSAPSTQSQRPAPRAQGARLRAHFRAVILNPRVPLSWDSRGAPQARGLTGRAGSQGSCQSGEPGPPVTQPQAAVSSGVFKARWPSCL